MDFWGYVMLIVGALAIGLLAEYVVRQQFGYEWLVTAVGAGIGGFIASEYLGASVTGGRSGRAWPSSRPSLVRLSSV